MTKHNNFDFCIQLKQLLETRQTTGRSGKVFSKLGALSIENNLSVLRTLMLELKPENTLEIGLAFDASCLALAASHRDLGHQPARQHVAIDPHQSAVWDDTARLVIERAVLGCVDVCEDFSSSLLFQLVSEGRKFNLICIDGSHLFEDVSVDFYYSIKLPSPQGLLLFDDSTDPHVRKVLSFIDANFSSSYEKLTLSYLRSGSTDKLKYTFAILLRKNPLTAYCNIGRIERPYNAAFRDF